MHILLYWAYVYVNLFLQYAGVWPKSDIFLLLLFFFLYIISIIAFGFLLRYMCI